MEQSIVLQEETSDSLQARQSSLFRQMQKESDGNFNQEKSAVQTDLNQKNEQGVSEFTLKTVLRNKRKNKIKNKDAKVNLFASAIDTVEIHPSSASQESFI